ncbi:MAG: DNA-3-methyladenine glycosylase family protein [Planctomycetaceae bacterium]
MSPTRTVELDGPLDLARTLFPLRRGYRDPVVRLGGGAATLALRTPTGGALLRLRQTGACSVAAEASGPGAEAALALAPGIVGAQDDPAAFAPTDQPLAALARRLRGVRLTRAPLIPVLLAAVLEQKVTGREAREGWRGLVLATSEPAGEGLWFPPDPARAATLPSFSFHRAGIDGTRARTVRIVAERAARLELEAREDPATFRTRLERLPGIGQWTSAEAARLALGDPDAVSVGDYHLPDVVAWVLAGEPRGDDVRMLALLEPYRGQRGRVQRLLEASGAKPPAYGPRAEGRSIARI